MKTKNLITIATIFPMMLIADEPNWLSADLGGNTATACATINGSINQAKVIAKAIATGRLSQSLGGHVSAKSELTTITKESDVSLQKEDTLSETVTIKSNHNLSRLEVIKSGKFNVNGRDKYCVLMKIKA